MRIVIKRALGQIYFQVENWTFQVKDAWFSLVTVTLFIPHDNNLRHTDFDLVVISAIP